MNLEQAQTNYELIFKKKAPAAYKNKLEWLQKKIEEQTPAIVKQVLPPKATKEKKGKTIEIYDKHGAFVRVYSKVAHGDKYEKLAGEFIDKLNKQ